MFSAINFPQGSKEENLANALNLIADNKIDGAIKIYSYWLTYLSKDIDFLKARAAAYIKNKQMIEAKKDLDRIKIVKAEFLILEIKDRLEQIKKIIIANSDEQYNENTRREVCKCCFKIGLAYAQIDETQIAVTFLFLAAHLDTHFFPYNGEVKPENNVTDEEQVAAFRYLQKNVEHKEEAVKDHTQAVLRYSENKIQHAELSVVYKMRAIVYKIHGHYDKALQDIILATWMNENPANKDLSVIMYFDLRKLLRDIFIDILNAEHAFEIQREILHYDKILREGNCKPGHLKLSRYEWSQNFCHEIFNRCNTILHKKKHDLNLDADFKVINFLAYVLKKIPDMAVNGIKQQEMDIFTLQHIQIFLRRLEKAYRSNQRLLDVIKLYKHVLVIWPDNEVFHKRLRIAEFEADPSFRDDEFLEQKEILFSTKPPKVKESNEQKKKITSEENPDDQFKGTGALLLQKLTQDRMIKEDQARKARNQKNKNRNKLKKSAFSRRAAKQLTEEQETKDEQEAELKFQQQEALRLKQLEEKERQLAEEKEQRQKTLNNFKAGIEQRQLYYEKQKKAFEERQAEKKSATVVSKIKILPDEWVLLDTLENSGADVKAELYGGAVRTRAFQLFGLASNDTINDLDVKTTLTSDQIFQVLKPFNVETISFRDEKGNSKVKENFFKIKSFRLSENNQVNFLNVQISHKLSKSYLEDAKELDFTVNTLTANKFGELRDPTGFGLKHIKDRILATVIPSADSFEFDPSRTLRGGFYKFKYNLTADDELMVNMEKFADQIPTMKEVFRIHSWMKSHFSTPSVAVDNFKFLQHPFQNPKTKNEWNFLNKLFSPDATQKIMKSENWICHQLQQGVKTIAEIYMIFYVAIAMNTEGYLLDPVSCKKAIFAENPLLNDALGRPSFRFVYEKYLQRWSSVQPSAPFQFYRPNGLMTELPLVTGLFSRMCC